MGQIEEGNGLETEYTQDGTVDLKGRRVLRAETGDWNACSFIVGYEVFERMAYYGISSNLVVYLTTKLHEGTVTSSNNVTNWVGTVWMTPVLGAYIADAHLGRYWTFVIGSAIYLSGMCLLTLTVSIPKLSPPSCPGIKDALCDKKVSAFQKGIFYCALYIIAIGTGGTKPNISTMGADQFDEFEPNERKSKLSFFNWWMFSIFFGALISNTFLVYIQDTVNWSLGYGLPTLGLAFSILVFMVGTKFYRHKLPSGSPFTRMAKVFVAATRKWGVQFPNDPKELYELGPAEYAKSSKFPVDRTPSLRFLDKAAVKRGNYSPWACCPVTQIEETKQMIKMLPILVTTFIPSTIVAQVGTLFIKQGTTLERRLGRNFEIPPASLGAFVTIFMLLSLILYDRLFVPFARKYTKNLRGITLLQRMGIGLLLHCLIMIIAAVVERKRLDVAKQHGIFGKGQTVPLTIFILLPQFALMGVADAFVEVAKLEFFYDQAPEGMKSLGTSYFSSSLGIGSFLSSFLLKTAASITKRNGHKGWILDNLNQCHFDYYYAFLAVLSFFNLALYLGVSKFYVYNVDAVKSKQVEEESVESLPKNVLS
ncbi:unnamed protein product [Rhodiola kirilowii]